MPEYRLAPSHVTLTNVRPVGPGLVKAVSCDKRRAYGDQVWSAATSRKPGSCVLSNEAFAAGEQVYRPMTSLRNRVWRVLAAVMQARCSRPREHA